LADDWALAPAQMAAPPGLRPARPSDGCEQPDLRAAEALRAGCNGPELGRSGPGQRLPVGAGLAGSSDAAATLLGPEPIMGSGVTGDDLQAEPELGSDCAFCLAGGTQLCSGRATLDGPSALRTCPTPLAQLALFNWSVLLIKTPRGVSNPLGLWPLPRANCAATLTWSASWISKKRPARGLRQGPCCPPGRGATHCRALRNDLPVGGGAGAGQRAPPRGCPARQARRRWGGMSGSGPSLFALLRIQRRPKRPGQSGRSTPAAGVRKLGVARCQQHGVRLIADAALTMSDSRPLPSYPRKPWLRPAESGEVKKTTAQGPAQLSLRKRLTVAWLAGSFAASASGSWFN